MIPYGICHFKQNTVKWPQLVSFSLFTATTKTLILFGLLFWSHSAACGIDLSSLTRDQARAPCTRQWAALTTGPQGNPLKTLTFTYMACTIFPSDSTGPDLTYECMYVWMYIYEFIYIYTYTSANRYAVHLVMSHPLWPVDCSPPGSSVHGTFQQEYWSG